MTRRGDREGVMGGRRTSVHSFGGFSLSAGIAILLILSLCSRTPPMLVAADDVSDAVATVGDRALSRADLERVERRMTFFGAFEGVPRSRRRAFAVRRLVEETLLEAEAERRGIEVTEEMIDDRVALLARELSTRSQSLDRMLAATGFDRDSLRAKIRREIAAQILASGLVTADDMREVSEAHHHEFDGTRHRVSHLLLRPNGAGDDAALVAEAGRIRAEIVSGAVSFAEAAARHSAAPSRHRGGDIGFIPRHGRFDEEFARAAFSLKKGSVSEPVVSPFGVHLVTVTDVDAGTAGPETVRPHLERIAAEAALARLLDECRERTPVNLAAGVEIEPASSRTIDPR